jgi:non-ribosomal peptide synthetase component F
VLNLGLSWAARHWARYRPNHVAIQTEIASLTYKQLDDMAIHVAMYLLDRQIAPQQPVGLIASDASIVFPMTLGTLRAGAQVILLNPAGSPAALGRACDDAGLDIVVIETPGRDVPCRGQIIPWDAVMAPRGVTPPGPSTTASLAGPPDAPWGTIPKIERTDSVGAVRHTDLSMLMELISWAFALDIRSTTTCYTGRSVSDPGGFLVPATGRAVSNMMSRSRACAPIRCKSS